MGKKLSALVKQNLTLCFRNSLIWVVLISMIIIVLFVNFLVPREYETTGENYYLDLTSGRSIETHLKELGMSSSSFMSDLEELEGLVSESSNAVGVVFTGEKEMPSVEVLYNFHIGPEQKNIINVSINKLVGTINDTWQDDINISFLRDQALPTPRHLATVPVLLVFEVLILGFLLVAVFLFQEKGDNVIRAYRVTPGGTHLYILSKVVTFLLLGFVYAFGILIFTYGVNLNIFNFIILTFLGFILYTLLGLIVAVFFEDISGWFIVGIVLLTLNMIPAISHQLPSFAPSFITWVPSYHIIFGYDEILFPTGKNLNPLFASLLVQNIVAYISCYLLVNKKIIKGVF